jgi:hypothetical protein
MTTVGQLLDNRCEKNAQCWSTADLRLCMQTAGPSRHRVRHVMPLIHNCPGPASSAVSDVAQQDNDQILMQTVLWTQAVMRNICTVEHSKPQDVHASSRT